MPTASNRQKPGMLPIALQSTGQTLRKMVQLREFPDGSVVRTLHFYCEGPGSIPG